MLRPAAYRSPAHAGRSARLLPLMLTALLSLALLSCGSEVPTDAGAGSAADAATDSATPVFGSADTATLDSSSAPDSGPADSGAADSGAADDADTDAGDDADDGDGDDGDGDGDQSGGVPDVLSQPDTSAPDTAIQKDTAQPDTTQPDTAQADTAQPDTSSGCNCDDNDSCTKDTCVAGVCTHTIVVDCSPMNGPCTQGVCKNGSCGVEPANTGSNCNDGDSCTTGDSCQGGKCTGTAKDCSGKAGPCTTASCAQGACKISQKANGVSCNDGNPCTVGDTCLGGTCTASPMDCSKNAGPCTLASCQGGSCVTKAKPKGTACQDGDACTSGDVCDGAGSCTGKVKNCSAKGGVCAVGVCVNGTCTSKPKANGTSCSDGDSCTLGDVCKSGTCVGKAKLDSMEPNGSAPGKKLGSKSDCDPESSFTASISPKTDVDWYSFDAEDKSFCTIQPEVNVSGPTGGGLAGNVELCMYFQCGNGKSGSSTVTCQKGNPDSGGPGGLYGCCATEPGKLAKSVKIKPKCSTLGAGSESGKVFVRLRATGTKVCGGYKLRWRAAK